MRILITGASGQLGRDLRRQLRDHDVVPLSHTELDVSDVAAVSRAVSKHAPDVVLHCAALTDTTKCESDPRLANAVNTRGTENIAKACASNGARLVAISTNEVFDGEKRTPYAEDDAARPVNAYGRSKLEAERLAFAADPGAIVVRTSWLYGDGGNNYVEKVLAAARSGRPLRFATDEIATPTSTCDLAAAICALVDAGAPAGIYHLANEGEASRYEWTCETLRLAGITEPVEPVTTAQLRGAGYSGPLKPAYSTLANRRAAAIGVTLQPWGNALAQYFARSATPANG